MSAEILPFRTKKLTGFLPEEEVRLPAGLEKAYREVRKELADLVDMVPAEYCAPENDPT
jgi:hypothetical protein